jgi:hypothetical protein
MEVDLFKRVAVLLIVENNLGMIHQAVGKERFKLS